MINRARLASLLGCAALAACGPVAPTSSAVAGSPSPSASASAATPAEAPPSPTPTPASCRLPLAAGDAQVDGRPAGGATGHGGFLELPSGAFTADPASLGTYDRAVSRWLPVFRAWVAPDGRRYAWGDPQASVIHVVDAASGADRAVGVSAPASVVSYEAEGVYVARAVPDSGAPLAGLGLLDPASGAYRAIVADGRWVAVGGGFAFGLDRDPAVAPPAGDGPGAANRVRRLDLRTGAVAAVGSYPGASAQVLAVYGSEPLIGVTAGAIYSVFLGGGAGARTVFTGPTADADPGAPAVVDGATVWFSSRGAAVWRWPGTGRATRVADVPLRGPQVAGGCR
jgi:hypothetical protein